jgi:hypothetical protein
MLPQPGGRAVFFEIPALRPAASTHLYGRLVSTTGATLELDLYATLNALRDDFTGAHPSDPEKPSVLILPEAEGNGNTYQVITDFYDTITGRALVKREVTDEVPWDKSTLNYAWIHEHILTKHCVLCHQPGMPHDLTTYEKLVERIRPGMPEKSHALGLVKTGSMPPFGLPALHPRSIAALEEWIRLGAPR